MKHDLINADFSKLGQLFTPGQVVAALENNIVTLRFADNLSAAQQSLLRITAMNLLSWRQGPYRFVDPSGWELILDSEWQGDFKWQRIKKIIGYDSAARNVADIGCSNGYYSIRALLEEQPNQSANYFGFDPFKICYYQYRFLDFLCRFERFNFVGQGVEQIKDFPQTFDLILFMGVLYHRKDPLQTLLDLRGSLIPGGRMILETMVLPTEESYQRVTKTDQQSSGLGHNIAGRHRSATYSKMTNVHTLTNPADLYSLIEKAGFSAVRLHSLSETSLSEQRSTVFSPYGSLESFLQTDSKPLKTIENMPAPRRILLELNV